MYRPKSYAVDDLVVLHETIRARRFATIAAVVDGSIQFAYAPVVLHPQSGPRGEVRFHLARANPLANVGGAHVRLSFLGPDAYISPDWYTSLEMVPTWNYIAVEGEGVAQTLDDNALRSLLVELSAAEEERLRPKMPWTLDKISPSRRESLLKAIRGFAVRLDTLAGKFKLSQDKTAADVRGVIQRLQSLNDPASAAVAAAMRSYSPARERGGGGEQR